MAISLYTGPLGNGKTISAVGAAIESTWFRGGYVFSNVSFDWPNVKEHFKAVYGATLHDCQYVPLNAAQVPEFYLHCHRGTREVPVLLIIDEAGKYFNSKAWNKGLSEKMTNSDFLRESRKLHVEVIFIVQNEERLDKSFRELMEYRFRFRCLKWIPLLRRMILQIKEHADTGVRIKTRWWWCDKRYFKLYDTDALYSDWKVADIPELQPVTFDQKPKKPTSFMIRFCIILGIAWFAWGWITKIGSSMGKAPSVAPKAAAAAPAPVAQAEVVTTPSGVQVQRIATRAPGERVVVENMRSTDERTYIRTASGYYEAGRWSAHGLVESVERGAAICRAPDGGRVVVVARDWQDPELAASVKALALAQQAAPPFAPVDAPQPTEETPKAPTLADREQARIRKELAKPIGHDNNKRRNVAFRGTPPAIIDSVPTPE